MPDICMYFQVHQPMRLRKFSIFGHNDEAWRERYFDAEKNRQIMEKVAEKCYRPTNRLLLDLIGKHDGAFRLSFSLTGVFIEQCREYAPDVLESFAELYRTGCVEFLSETYYHSLASLFADKREFGRQVKMHDKALHEIGIRPSRVFRNTEALYSNEIGRHIEGMGYEAAISEGWDYYLGWRSPNYVYKAKGSGSEGGNGNGGASKNGLRLLLRNYKLSDDLSYRFSARWWPEYPLTADKYASWLAASQGQCVNLFMDYETFGEHQWADTGIFEFLRHMPGQVLGHPHLGFALPSEIVRKHAPVDEVDVPYSLTWADMERDTSAWLGNEMQKECFAMLEGAAGRVEASGDPAAEHAWRLLQNSDHLYYLCTKSLADGDVHKYFSPYQNPYDGFINFMNILQDFRDRLEGTEGRSV
ncbi:Glycosyl hydrolase family 57 [Candidatus Burarchaeum australiense]|nr:Glycosyl hydrolase family 57 [Candidatus Burarchaeum australiense]